MTELFVFMFKGYGRRHSVATALAWDDFAVLPKKGL
jgi:hypothetical protein